MLAHPAMSGRSVTVDGGPTSGPEETAGEFARALLARDAATATDLFSPGALFLTPDGTEVGGRAAIGDILTQLTDGGQRLEIRLGRTTSAETVAISVQYWKRSSPDVAAERFEHETFALLVLRREGGRWSIVIASPWG